MSWQSSPSIEALSAALVEALSEMTEVRKGKQAKIETRGGGSYGYRYADLGDTLQTVRPVLARHGLAVLQHTHTDSGDSVLISTTILHRSGEWLRFDPLALPAGRTAQETGSAITYGRRYTLLAALGLATEDDDGASAAPRGRAPQRQARPADEAQPAERRPAPASSPDQPEARTDEEGQIRRLLLSLPDQQKATIRARFRGQFGESLIDLSPERHSEALEWVRSQIAEEQA